MNSKVLTLTMIATMLVLGCSKLDRPQLKTKVEYRAKANYAVNFTFKDEHGMTIALFDNKTDFTYSWYQDSAPVYGDSTLCMTMTSPDARSDTNMIAIYLNDSLKNRFTTYGGGNNVNMKIAY